MSIASFFEHMFDGAEVEVGHVATAFSGADQFVDVVMGVAQAVSPLLPLVPGGAAMQAGVAALAEARGLVRSAAAQAVAAGSGDVQVLARQVATLHAQAADVMTQIAPLFRVVANSTHDAAQQLAAVGATAPNAAG